MKYIDMHCDTLMQGFFRKAESIDHISCMVNFDKMQAGNAMAQFFAIFLPANNSRRWREYGTFISDDDYVEQCIQLLHRSIEKNEDRISLVLTAQDLADNNKAGKLSAILSMEDGRAVRGKLDKLDEYYKKGIRMISLTWNNYNCFGAPNSSDPLVMNDGLTEFGKAAVERMNDLGIIVDVSHLSDRGFWDVMEISKSPIVASHSNCRAVCPHQRNLTDDMIRALAEKGGISGLNYFPAFINQDITCTQTTLKGMSTHIKHMIQTGGEDFPALGSDFDGIHGEMEVDGADKIQLLFEYLKRDGLTETQIEKVAFKNVCRVVENVWK